MRRKNHMAPARIILIGFALLILAGALLLTLPISTRDGQGAAFFDALFTATSVRLSLYGATFCALSGFVS